MFISKTSLIIPTRNRLSKIKRLFASKNLRFKSFNEILIIDSSEIKMHKELVKKFVNFKNIKIIKSKPSTSLQRNKGIKSINKKNKFIMFCDDDILFKKNSFFEMNKFFKENPKYIGYGFNLVEKKNESLIDRIKKNKIFIKYGFYNFKAGIVCENGWHTRLSNVKGKCETMWLSTQACIYKSKFVKKRKFFDESLGNYSYLEDLFFSYSLNKYGKFAISTKSIYWHPNNIERKSYRFGVQEVLNRYKFVKKYKLNKKKFLLTFILKIIFVLTQVLFLRLDLIPKLFGNLIGFMKSLKK